MSLNDFADDRFSAQYLRRNPISGPIARALFRWIVSVLGIGLGVTGILCFTTGSPLADMTGRSGSELRIIALLLSPYVGMYLTAWYLIGSGTWRGAALLLGGAAVTLYGLFNTIKHWYILPRPISEKSLIAFPIVQWELVGVTLLVAMVPGMLIGLGLRAFDRSPPPRSSGSGPDSGDRTNGTSQ